jgi:hypothetical protein
MNRRTIGNEPFEIDTQLSHQGRAPAEHAGMVNVPIYWALRPRMRMHGRHFNRARITLEAEIRKHLPVLKGGPLNRVAAAGVAVTSLEALRNFFDRQCVTFTEGPSLDSKTSIWVGPNDAFETALAFFEFKQNEGTQG